jgi:glucose/arabinose dehydrogenase
VFTFPNAGLPPGGIPRLTVTPVVTGLTVPWDVAFIPGGTMLFTERPGRINAFIGGQVRLLAAPGDVRPGGEGGMMGIAVDPSFASTRRIYTCFNTTGGDIEVVVWTVNASVTALTRVGTLVDGLPQNASGRHSGCRPRVGPDGWLYVGTGDAATGTNPQDPNSLGGKVLRVHRVTGAAASGNPFGAKWMTRGHRNVQGIAFRPGTTEVFSVEQGTDRDDEVNKLTPGGNYGWNPVPGYDESKPMTAPGGIPAVWSSGFPTIATSGATFLSGLQWRDWNGALAVAALKGSHLRVLILDAAGTGVIAQYSVLTAYGRLRSPVLGPDGNLYVTTSNGSNDQILRVTPS